MFRRGTVEMRLPSGGSTSGLSICCRFDLPQQFVTSLPVSLVVPGGPQLWIGDLAHKNRIAEPRSAELLARGIAGSGVVDDLEQPVIEGMQKVNKPLQMYVKSIVQIRGAFDLDPIYPPISEKR
jgi:hypothetical protein